MGLPPGTLLDQFRIEGPIGAGSMGDVFRGIDVALERPVAIKILSEKHRDNRELEARFEREAKTAAKISHPNVVQVYATGKYDNRPYIAMELLNGVDLGTLVKTQGPMTSVHAAMAVLDTAKGLHAAASAGMIHRDVKPSNLVLLEDGRVKVTDFGLAKPMDPKDQPALTAMGVVVGTPDYIAPEQARGEQIDERVDIYALGGTLFYLLTGRPPFRKGNPHDDKYLKVVARHLSDPAPDARSLNPEVDAELADLALYMMAKKPSERPSYALVQDRAATIAHRLGGSMLLTGPLLSRPRTAPEPTPFVGDGRGPVLADLAGQRSPKNAKFAQTARGVGGVPATGPTASDPVHVGTANTEPRTVTPMASAAEPLHVAYAMTPTIAPAPLQQTPFPSQRATSEPAARYYSEAGLSRPPRSSWRGLGIALAAIVATAGLILVIVASDSDGRASTSADDAAAVPSDAAAALLTPSIKVPEGMRLVTHPDGRPWFLIDEEPVRQSDYDRLYIRTAATKKSSGDRPVSDVSLARAKNFAANQMKRLPTAEEWRAAVANRIIDPGSWREWVSGKNGKTAMIVSTVSEPIAATADSPGERRVTFRLALDLEAL